MSDNRSTLERELERLSPSRIPFEQVVRRRDRKRRNQRITAGVVGIAVFVAAVWIVTTAGSFNRTQQPAIQPTPTPEPSLTDPEVDYLLDLDTGATTPLPETIVGTEDLTDAFAASPDGSKLAYAGPGDDGKGQIFIANVDGTRVHQITHITRASRWPGSGGWSPDGTKIVYVGLAAGDRTSNVFVIDLTSGVTRQVTFETVDVAGTPQFSPDGSSIVYTAYRPGGQLRIVPVTGGRGSTLVPLAALKGWAGDAGTLALSPDGSLLAFGCGVGLCLANADGSDPRVIAEGEIMSASWSPDGSRLAFWRLLSGVYILDVATGEETRVANEAWPWWVDDHTLIIQNFGPP